MSESFRDALIRIKQEWQGTDDDAQLVQSLVNRIVAIYHQHHGGDQRQAIAADGSIIHNGNKRKALLVTLRALVDSGDSERRHVDADKALLAYIDDSEIAAAFNAIDKWYG